MDSRLLIKAKERVNLATKIDACEDSESRTNKSNQWFIKAAEDADLESLEVRKKIDNNI